MCCSLRQQTKGRDALPRENRRGSGSQAAGVNRLLAANHDLERRSVPLPMDQHLPRHSRCLPLGFFRVWRGCPCHHRSGTLPLLSRGPIPVFQDECRAWQAVEWGELSMLYKALESQVGSCPSLASDSVCDLDLVASSCGSSGLPGNSPGSSDARPSPFLWHSKSWKGICCGGGAATASPVLSGAVAVRGGCRGWEAGFGCTSCLLPWGYDAERAAGWPLQKCC